MKFKFEETILNGLDISARLSAGTGRSNDYTDKEVGKAVKLVGDSRYALCAAGDPIEGVVISMEVATVDDYTIGTVRQGGRKNVVLDGIQATPGTGTIAIGDYVVTGTAVAKDTALTGDMKVTKATSQAVQLHMWRLVSASGTAVASTGVIERVE